MLHHRRTALYAHSYNLPFHAHNDYTVPTCFGGWPRQGSLPEMSAFKVNHWLDHPGFNTGIPRLTVTMACTASSAADLLLAGSVGVTAVSVTAMERFAGTVWWGTASTQPSQTDSTAELFTGKKPALTVRCRILDVRNYSTGLSVTNAWDWRQPGRFYSSGGTVVRIDLAGRGYFTEAPRLAARTVAEAMTVEGDAEITSPGTSWSSRRTQPCGDSDRRAVFRHWVAGVVAT